MAMQTVVVARYSHKHVDTIRVFAKMADAHAWGEDLALEWFKDDLGRGWPAGASRAEIAAEYWALMLDRGEYIVCDEHAVQGADCPRSTASRGCLSEGWRGDLEAIALAIGGGVLGAGMVLIAVFAFGWR